MKIFLLAVILLAIAVLGMAVTIIVKPGGKFPDGEISHNKELRKRGIICAKEEELKMWGRRHKKTGAESGTIGEDCPEGGCEGCEFYKS